MAKYNEGDVLEITEDFELEYAEYTKGEKYTITEVEGNRNYYLESDKWDYSNTISEVDAHSGFRKVEPKVVFKVGDKVRLLEGAHGNPDFGYSWSTEEGFEKNFGYRYDLAEPFVVLLEIDYAGEVGISQDELNSYVLAEFLVPWVEEEKPAEHMELGKTYQSKSNDFLYTPTAIDFESDRVEFDFISEPGSFVNTSHRYFHLIEEEFGVLPPVKTVGMSQVTLGEVKTENTLAEAEAQGWEETLDKMESRIQQASQPETVSVDALREAMDYLGIQEVFDSENIISLAKRLS